MVKCTLTSGMSGGFYGQEALIMHPTHKGGRPVKHLSQNDVVQIEALAAMCTKGQIADYFGMTEKTFRAIEQSQPEVFDALQNLD